MTIDDIAPAGPVVAEPAERRPGQRIERRKGLPTGRAVVGGLLVTLAALGVFWAYLQANDDPSESYVVVTDDLRPGERLTASDLRLEPIDLPDAVASNAFRSTAALVGGVVIAPLADGQLLQSGDLVAPSDGEEPEGPAWREVSFLVPDDHAVGGRVRSGESVDLIATYEGGGESDTVVVFRSALVVRTAEPDGGLLGRGEALIYTVALEDPLDVLATVNAVDAARSITLVRSTSAGGIDLPDRFEGRDEADPADEDAGS